MKKIFFITLMFICASLFAQDSLKVKKDNRIIFMDFSIGTSPFEGYNPYINTSVNYQMKNHLFKVSFAEALIPDEIGYDDAYDYNYNPTLYFSGLYGQRFIIDWLSISVAGGLSYVRTKQINYQDNSQNQNSWDRNSRKRNYKILNGISVPIEVNLKIFKARKERFRVLCGIIPISEEPTSIGVSLGLKLFANISKKSYVGLGLSIGLGSHKVYK